jgi:heptosyltransferase I
LRTLQHYWPQTQITWIIGKTEAGLVSDIPGVEFIVFDKKQGWSAYRNLFRTLKNRHFDVLLHMQVSLRSSLASLAVKAPIRIGYDRARAKNFQWLFTNYKISPRSRQHVLDSFLEFPRALGLEETIIAWNIPIPQQAKCLAEEVLPQNRQILAINPCSSVRARNWRNWDIESYAQIIDHAAEHYGMITVLTGGPSLQEKDYAAAIVTATKAKPVNLVGRTNLKELLAVLTRAEVVIAPDTGPAHMANAAGTPVIGLYATSNPERTGPYLFRHMTVNKYPVAVRNEYQKEVEEIRWGKRVRSPDAMTMIRIEDVKKSLALVMAESRQGSTN